VTEIRTNGRAASGATSLGVHHVHQPDDGGDLTSTPAAPQGLDGLRSKASASGRNRMESGISAYGATDAFSRGPLSRARSQADLEGRLRIEMPRSASRQRTSAVCAFETFEQRLNRRVADTADRVRGRDSWAESDRWSNGKNRRHSGHTSATL
jgi:hypothetical protein